MTPIDPIRQIAYTGQFCRCVAASLALPPALTKFVDDGNSENIAQFRRALAALDRHLLDLEAIAAKGGVCTNRARAELAMQIAAGLHAPANLDNLKGTP